MTLTSVILSDFDFRLMDSAKIVLALHNKVYRVMYYKCHCLHIHYVLGIAFTFMFAKIYKNEHILQSMRYANNYSIHNIHFMLKHYSTYQVFTNEIIIHLNIHMYIYSYIFHHYYVLYYSTASSDQGNPTVCVCILIIKYYNG